MGITIRTIVHSRTSKIRLRRLGRRSTQRKVNRLREDTTDTNPAYLWLTEELVKSRADLATFQARATATAHNVQLYRQMSLDLEQKNLEQEDLIRNAKARRTTSCYILRNGRKLRISDALDSKRILNVAISEPPTVPALPAHSPWLFVLLRHVVSHDGKSRSGICL